MVIEIISLSRTQFFFNNDLQYENEVIAIFYHDVCKLRTEQIKSLKDQRRHRLVEESTWEIEKDM